MSVNLETLPLYIRRGSVIPYTKMKGNTKSYDVNHDLYFEIYPDHRKIVFDFYDDDGATLDYQNGKYTHIQLTSLENTLRVETVKAEYLKSDSFDLDFMILADRPNQVTVNGKESVFRYENGKIKISVQFDISESVYIEWK